MGSGSGPRPGTRDNKRNLSDPYPGESIGLCLFKKKKKTPNSFCPVNVTGNKCSGVQRRE